MWTRWRRSAAEQKIRIKRGVGKGEGLKEAARCISLALDWQLASVGGGRFALCRELECERKKIWEKRGIRNQAKQTNKQTKTPGSRLQFSGQDRRTLEGRGAAGPSGCSGANTATLPTNAHRHATERIKERVLFDSVAERPSGFI